MASRRHLTAFNKTAKALGVDADPVCAAVVALGRNLARTLDSTDDQVIWSRTAAIYLRLGREMKVWADRELVSRKPTDPTSTENEPNSDRQTPDNVNSLSAFIAAHGSEGKS